MTSAIDSGRAASATGPAEKFRAVTPDDQADLPGGVARSLHVVGAGQIVVRDAHGNQAAFLSGAGQYHPLRAARVMATGTTATGIVALY